MSDVTDQAASLRKMVAAVRPPLRVIGVCSGKGGVGKTMVSANLAVLAASQGLRVLVIDADLGLANVEVLYGIKPRYHLGHLLEGGVELGKMLATGPAGVKVLSGGSGLSQLSRLDDVQKLRLITALDPMEGQFDLVLLDIGAGIGENVLFFAGAAQEALVVLTPEPTSFTDAYAAIKVLWQQSGMRSFGIIVNEALHEQQAREVFGRLTMVTDRFLSAQVRWLGWLPRDENVHRAVMAQKPLVDLFPASPCARQLNVVAHTVLGEPAPAAIDGGLKILWQRLLREAPRAR
ncbi:MAG TPA: MinD/ParA family protein [Myxococcales bacterium]|nr:MinD/ParA family protein [Myxococcales bacterium]